MSEVKTTRVSLAVKRQKDRHRRNALLALLGCMVVFATAFTLMVPAISMTRGELVCGLEEHEHTSACYEKVLVCGKEEGDDHEHDDSCYEEQLVCDLVEHAHSDVCYEPEDAQEEPVEEEEADSEEEESSFEPEETPAEQIEYSSEDAAVLHDEASLESDVVPSEGEAVMAPIAEMPIAPRAAAAPMAAPLAASATTQSSIMDGRATNGANDWQIVSGGYKGNSSGNKTVSSDGFVRVQKNVIPTGVENEFYVYLSIDTKTEKGVTKSIVDEFLASATYVAGSSTHGTGNDVGTIGALQGSEKGLGDHGLHINLFYDGVKIGETDVGIEVSNPSLYLKLDPAKGKKDRNYILLLESNGQQSGNLETANVNLNTEAYNALVKQVEKTTETITSVTNLSVLAELSDTNRFKRLETVYCDGSFNSAVGSWNVLPKSSPVSTTTVIGSGTSNEVATTWSENVAELLYKVTLNTTDAAFESSSGVYFPGSSDAQQGDVDRGTATQLTYEYGTVNSSAMFPDVSVKGFQYGIKIFKANEDGEALGNVEFSLTGSDGNGLLDNEYVYTTRTDNQGNATFSGLAWGAYTISEIGAPSGYRKAEDQSASLCYTTNSDNLADIAGDKGVDKIYKSAKGENYLTIVNKKNVITVTKDVAAQGELPKSDIDHTIYIALWDRANDRYVADSDGNIVHKQMTISGGTVSPASVQFEGIDTGIYDVMELASVNGSECTELKTGDRFKNSKGTSIQLAGVLSSCSYTNADGQLQTNSASNDAVLTYSNTAWVNFTNAYSYPTTTKFVANKKWASADGTQIGAPTGATVTFTLYSSVSSGTPQAVQGVEPITLDGTPDESGEERPWEATFANLPLEDASGHKYDYMVRETACSTKEFAAYRNNTDATPMGSSDYMNQDGGTIWNKQKVAAIVVKKVDDKGAPLSGAKFKLFRTESGKPDELVGNEFTVSDAGGYTISNLVSGTYKLTETGAPSGYIILDSSIEFTVNATGEGAVIGWGEGARPENVSSLSNTGAEDDTITVTNTPGQALPNTGGTGTVPYTLSGLALIGLAAMYGFRMRRRERRSRG